MQQYREQHGDGQQRNGSRPRRPASQMRQRDRSGEPDRGADRDLRQGVLTQFQARQADREGGQDGREHYGRSGTSQYRHQPAGHDRRRRGVAGGRVQRPGTEHGRAGEKGQFQ